MNANLQHTIELTKNILKKDGFQNYLPTLILIDKKEIRVLEEIPENISQEQATKEWIRRINIAQDNLFLIFKISNFQVKIESYKENKLFESVIINESDC